MKKPDIKAIATSALEMADKLAVRNGRKSIEYRNDAIDAAMTLAGVSLEDSATRHAVVRECLLRDAEAPANAGT